MIPALEKPEWIAVDWGTTHLRAWAMGRANEVLDFANSDDGMSRLTPDAFEPALIRLVSHWLGTGKTPVIACGMVGSRQGWAEAPYRAVPCVAQSETLISAPCTDPRLDMRIIPGVKQASPADVMRGEETQIAGFLAKNPNFDGVLCLPGTHSKWVHISAKEIVSFRTFMTGELFDLLGTASVLRHSIAPKGWDQEAFLAAMSETLSRPEQIAARLFSLRAESLLNDQNPAEARARLSGLLIGMELAAAKPYWLGQSVALIGAHNLTQTYASALSKLGVTPTIAEGSAMTQAGLISAYETMKAPL
jgi:2-dehydro-3-deoxygalactonokinase